MWNLRRASIGSRLLSWFLLLAFLPIGVLTVLNTSRAARSVEEDVRVQLTALAEQKAVYIEKYAAQRQRDVTILSREPNVIGATARFGEVFRRAGLRSKEYEAADAEVRPYLRSLVETSGYSDLFLITPEGDVVFSVRQGEDLGSSCLTGH